MADPSAPPKPRRRPPAAGIGRKVGTVCKKTIARRELAKYYQEKGLTPIQVMYQNMEYAHQRAQAVLAKVDSRLKSMPAEGGTKALREIIDDFKGGLAFRELSQKFAVDLAPFVHPRLSTIAVKPEMPDGPRTGVEVRFIDTALSSEVAKILDEDDSGPGERIIELEAAE